MFKIYTKTKIILSLDFSFQLEKNNIAFAINQLVESIPEERFIPFHHQMGPSSYQSSYRIINRFRVNPLMNILFRECFVQFRNQLVKE